MRGLSSLADGTPGLGRGDLPSGRCTQPILDSALGCRCVTITAVGVLPGGALAGDAPGWRISCVIICVV